MRPIVIRVLAAVLLVAGVSPQKAAADSVNSPNITLNVDTNRATATGNGAGNVSIAVNTITLAETSLPEYSSGAGKLFTLKARPGYQFDPTSNITAQSATIGFNNSAPNIAAAVTPTGAADEVITFNLTSGTNNTVQDIIRVNGIKVRILNAAGAAGPAQTTLSTTTSTMGGAFTDQGIVAANIVTGAPDHLSFSVQPATNQAGQNLLPVVQMLDFGNNLVSNNALARTISLSIQTNPGSAMLLGTTQKLTASGSASFGNAEAVRINVAANGYVLRASHSGANFLTSDTVDSAPFDILAGAAGALQFTTQPVDTVAGEALIVSVTAVDNLNNPISGIPVTLSLGSNPADASLLVDTTLTKNTVSGVAVWDATDALRVIEAGADFSLAASGVASPVESNAFDIVAGTPNSVRYLQQPSDTEAGAAMSPPIVAEVIDLFGNTTSFSGTLTLSLVVNPCLANIFGNVATAVNGVATFDNLVIDTACNGYVLKGAAGGLIAWAPSDRFNVTPPQFPIFLNSMELQPGKKVKVVARGAFALPNRFIHPPTLEGGAVTFASGTGTAQFSLSARKWKGLGPKKNGSQGFSFKDSQCSKVEVKANKIEVTCKVPKRAFTLPDPGPISMVLDVGQGIRYCGVCGGTPSGNQAKKFKQLNCSAPVLCQ